MIMNLMNIMLQAAPANGGMWQQIMMIALILVIFYFFLIRPQMKRSKEAKKFRDSLQKGQKIVTIGGIHGKIVEIDENTVTIQVENEGRLRMEKSAIASSATEQLPNA